MKGVSQRSSKDGFLVLAKVLSTLTQNTRGQIEGEKFTVIALTSSGGAAQPSSTPVFSLYPLSDSLHRLGDYRNRCVAASVLIPNRKNHALH